MNTTAAALEAHVTADTIRTWARRGVIAATKTAGRWIIDAASLARRITIGAMRRTTRREATVIDLTATYTYTMVGDTEPTIVAPKVKRRSNPRVGNLISITNLAPFFADRFDAITNEGDRLHALTVFTSALIVISDQADDDWDGDPLAREGGQLRTTYRGGSAGITVDDILDLAAQLRTQLAARTTPEDTQRRDAMNNNLTVATNDLRDLMHSPTADPVLYVAIDDGGVHSLDVWTKAYVAHQAILISRQEIVDLFGEHPSEDDLLELIPELQETVDHQLS